MYLLPRAEIKNCNVLIDGKNFYDHPINDLSKQCDEIKKVLIGQGDNYTAGCLLDYARLSRSCWSKIKTIHYS